MQRTGGTGGSHGPGQVRISRKKVSFQFSLLDDVGFSDSLLRFQAVRGLAVGKLEIVLQSLLKTYCLPCLYYGLESFDMIRSEMNKLNVPIMRAFNKIFHVFDKNSVQLCMYYC